MRWRSSGCPIPHECYLAVAVNIRKNACHCTPPWHGRSAQLCIGGRSVLRRLSIAVGFCLLWALAPAAAAATKPAVAAKPQAPSQATIYFFRPKALIGLGSLDILIDGQKVGELAPG